MHYLGANKTAGEKARRQLNKNEILNKSWRQHPIRHQLYSHLHPPSRKLSKLNETDMQDTAGEAGTRSYVMYSYWPPQMAGKKQHGQLEHTFSSFVRTRDVALRTYRRRCAIGRSGERGSGISVLVKRHDDDGIYLIIFLLSTLNNIFIIDILIPLSTF